jgi:hypothetical protein
MIVSRHIRQLNKGETCSFRVRAICGAPAFSVSKGGAWSSTPDDFNITWNEFEVDSV